MSEKISIKERGGGHPPETEMSFWEHLEALRWHFIRSAIAILVMATIALIYNKFIFDEIILAPKRQGFITNRLLCWFGNKIHVEYFCVNNLNLKIINTDMSGQLTTSIWVSLIAGLIFATPYILWEFWKFVKPALKEKERKYSRNFVFVTSSLFLTGIIFSYFLIVPLTVNFLGTYKVSESVENYISLNSYISTVTTLSFATGLVFEFPIFVYFLTKIGLITPHFLSKQRRYIIVIILIIAAIITPPDVFSQIMVSIPLYGLFELSIFISRMVYRRKNQDEKTANPAG
jgi:sec-independent protein translocase protein TatC